MARRIKQTSDEGRESIGEALALFESATPVAPNRTASVKKCIDAYHDAFLAKMTFKPRMGSSAGRFARELKVDLIPAWGEAAVLEVIAAFFTVNGYWSRFDYSIPIFLRYAQEIKVAISGPRKLDARTSENIEAARRAARR